MIRFYYYMNSIMLRLKSGCNVDSIYIERENRIEGAVLLRLDPARSILLDVVVIR